MRRILRLVLVFGLLAYPTVSTALERLQFEEEFGGKGAAIGQFGQEIYVAFDKEGTIYISDSDNYRVQKLGPQPMEIKPQGEEGIVFNHPSDIAVDKEGKIYVTDWRGVYVPETDNPKLYKFMSCVHIFDSKGRFLRTIDLGVPEARPKALMAATAIVDRQGEYALAIKPKGWDRELRIDVSSQGEIFILDIIYNRILKFNQQGDKLLEFGSHGSEAGQIDDAKDLSIDGEGFIYLADTGNNRIVKFNSEGEFQLSFGRKGLGSGEFIGPFAIVATPAGQVLVADEGEFERKFEDHPFTAERGRANPEWLEEALLTAEEGEELVEEEIERPEFPTKYLKVLKRIQLFSPEGRFRDKTIFKIDKTHPELHDLSFLAIDPFGKVYLRDEDRGVIRRYRMEGSLVMPRWPDIDKAYAVRTTRDEMSFEVDLGDIDTVTDEEDKREYLTVKQAFSLNYDLSERSKLSLKDLYYYTQREDSIWDYDNPANDYNMNEEGYDNSLGVNFRYVLNPNIYKYREMKFFVKGLAGDTRYRGRATEEELSKRHTRRGGEAKAILVGTEYDLTRDATLSLGYSYIEPDQTTRNFETYLYDTRGQLYYADRHYNKRRMLVGEFMIKF